MPVIRLSRPNQTWALALVSSFANPKAPTTAELNDRRFVHLISCALTEDATSLTRGDSQIDNTLTFCSIGNEATVVQANITASISWLRDGNTGGSGSTVDLTSLYNKVTAMLDGPDIPYWFISRTGPNASQDTSFVVGHKIKMARFLTDYPIDTLSVNTPVRGTQALVFQGDSNWNYTIAS